MRLKLLAISDTHLGEGTSLLSFPHGRWHLWQSLRKQFGEGENKGKFSVEQMILLGDIPDRTLSSTSQIITHTNALVRTLGSVADIETGVYIPGNHDHTLWTDYCKKRYGQGVYYRITPPEGEYLVRYGKLCCESLGKTEVMATFFGYPHGSSWRKIRGNKFNFLISNPLYATKINNRTYVFTHGTHFKCVVTLRRWIKRLCDYLHLDRLLGGIEIKSNCEVREAKSLKDLERIVTPFVDTLWPSPENNPTSQSDQLWYLLTSLSHRMRKKRATPDDNQLIHRSDLPNEKLRVKRLTDDNHVIDHSVKSWDEHFRKHLLEYLCEFGIPDKQITFVYGDTHDGGWGELSIDSDHHFRIYNCGGWVVHGENEHPACHVFVVDEKDEEHIFDISFKDMKIGDDLLLNLAAEDFENQKHLTSLFLPPTLNFLKKKKGRVARRPL